jgi:mycothiol synthase
LAWADARARATLDTAYGHPAWFVNVFVEQTQRRRDLEQAGFASQADVDEDSWSKVLLRREAAPLPSTPPLPPGFSLRPLAGDAEAAAYVDLHRAVFESKNMTEAWRLRTLRHADYRPELDLVAVAPDGRLAAFCVGWWQSSGAPAGQIEPMGVHADFRRLGLGRAILSEVVRRLTDLGAQQIEVETDNYRNAAYALYAALGFRLARDVLVYRKDYAAG